MKIEKEIRDAYGPIKPLPGGEDRMWIAIDRALDGKAREVQIQLRPHRLKLRPFLTAAAVIVLLLMSLALLRTLRPGQERAELLAATGTAFPDPEPTPERNREIRAVELVNAQVNGSELLSLSEEGEYLARAVLPEGFCVDHWEINGESVEAPSRRFSLLFDSRGVKKVEAVLREERHVSCVNAYLQFLDEKGEPAGWMYRDLCFEYDYTVPTTGLPHPGGSVSAVILPIIPEGMELEGWLIDGERAEASDAAGRILLDGLDRSLTVEALLREKSGAAGKGGTLTLGSGGSPGELPDPPEDDRPAGLSGLPENLWQEIDYEQDGVPFDPDAPARDGHLHLWQADPEHSWASTCAAPGQTTYVCGVCGRSYSSALPILDHSFEWAVFPDSIYVYDVCTQCGYRVRLDITIYDLGLAPRPTEEPAAPVGEEIP